MDLHTVTAIASGAASGMGLLFSRNIVELGGNIVMADINEPRLMECAAELNALGKGNALPVVCDVRDYAQVVRVRDTAVERFGRIDLLVNFAGGTAVRMLNVDKNLEFPDIPIEVYDWGIDVNLKAQFYFDHAVMKQMRDQRSGLIINIGSITGVEGDLKAGDTLLMQAGASGLASVVIPMAKSFGARVITTVMNDELEQAIRHLPTDLIVNTARQKLADVLKAELDAGRGVDLAIDCLGGDTVGECLPYLNFDGRWIMIATLAGDPSTVNLRSMYARRTRLIGTNLRSRTPAQKKQLLSDMVRLIWPKVESGEIRPTIFRVFPIRQAEQAQALMQSGRSAGKIVLSVR